MDWIQGQKFEQIADFIYSPNEKARDDYDKVQDTLVWSKLKDKSIVYTHTMYVKQLFELIRKFNMRLIVVSHNSDINIDETFEIPDNVYKWYSQNVNFVHPKLESIPIGIENDRWMKKVNKKAIMLVQLKKSCHIVNMVYMNHNISTNVIKRLNLYQMFENKSWVTSERGKNGKDFEHYISQIYNHQFMICPEGNGTDTHRMWECLYMGTIPIVKRNINNSFYESLPICFVDDWDEITESFLRSEYDKIHGSNWNEHLLTFEYWKNLIKNSLV